MRTKKTYTLMIENEELETGLSEDEAKAKIAALENDRYYLFAGDPLTVTTEVKIGAPTKRTRKASASELPAVPKKRAGRPKGSKNRPKLEAVQNGHSEASA